MNKSHIQRAEKALERKYGPAAWEWMPHWGKVRNRLEPRIYERYHERMLWVAMVVPAVAAALIVNGVGFLLRTL